jgi:hypothetical protein
VGKEKQSNKRINPTRRERVSQVASLCSRVILGVRQHFAENAHTKVDNLMNDRQQLKVRVSELSNEDLFAMVNEEIVNYRKEEINLAYEEMERRGILPNPTDETSQPIFSPIGCLIRVTTFIVGFFIIDSKLLTHFRAIALASFVYIIADYWRNPKPNTTFWKWALWAATITFLGSLALWDIPNLLRQHIPIMLAFGIPTLVYSLAMYWMSKLYRPSRKSKFTIWLIGCIIFTIYYSCLMSSYLKV